MNKRTRIRQRIAAVISTLLILQMMMPAELVNAAAIPDTSEAYLAETITDVSDEAGITIDEEAGDESASEGLPAEELTTDPLLEEGLLDDQDDLSELEELSDTVEEGLTEEEVSENALLLEGEAETTGPAENAATKAKMTVMLYSLGSDLEGKSMSATVDILEIMEGIYLSDTGSENVNFVVETGGVDTDIRNRAKIIAERRAELTERYKSDAQKQKRYLDRYDLLTVGDDYTAPISWGENERYLIKADELEAVQKQLTEPSRLMTYEDNNKVIPELAEFIKTTKADYPADQYMLILWNHGGGPIGGLGPDDRDRRKENKLTIQAWNIAPTMKEAGVTENTKFAYVNYDACLMGNLENALAWSPYANYYCGSEDLEPNDGDFYENWVSILCKEAADPSKNFTNQKYVDTLIERIGKQNVNDFHKWYSDREDMGTKSFIKLSKMSDVSDSLSDYADKINKLFTLDPIETYYSININRNLTQDFGGREMGIMDIGCFVNQLKSEFLETISYEAQSNTSISTATDELKKSGDKLISKMNDAVYHKETDRYFLYDLHGLTTYMPYRSLSRNDIKKYLNNYNAITPTSKSLKSYRKFVGTFCAIQAAGKIAAENDKAIKDIRVELTEALDQYGISDLYTNRMMKVPDEIIEHRIQNEALKISKDGKKYYYTRRDDNFVSAVMQAPYFIKKGDADELFYFLGYLPAGGAYEKTQDGKKKRELINYADKYWFGFKGSDGKYIPVAIDTVDSGFVDTDKEIPGDPFTAKTDVLIPILYDGGLNLLDVGFEKDATGGKIYGMYPFDYDNRGFSRYIDINSLVSENKTINIGLLCDMPNTLAGEKGAIFDKAHPEESIIANVNIKADTKLYRKIKLCDNYAGDISTTANIAKMEMRYVIEDVFGSMYNFEEEKASPKKKVEKDYEEEVVVEPQEELTRKPRNSQLKSSDLKLRFTGKANKTVYDDSQLTKLKYYYKDKNGDRVDLKVSGGKLCVEEGENFEPFVLTDKTVIYVDASNKQLEKLDGATEDLETYFDLKTDDLQFTFDVITAPDSTTSSNKQYTSKSKEYAKRAIPDDIADVTYTGRPLLTTQSTGNGSKVIDLVIYSEDGDSMLREGIDYTVSYRNNKNVGKMTDKNPPTLTINGKGDYAGMKYIARFNILKADMKDVELTFNKHFVPLNKKGISLGITATLPSGVKIPANQIAYEYYGLSGNKISVSDFQKAYAAGTEMMPFTVKAVARSNAKNLTGKTGSYPSNDELYAYPKNKGSLKVSLSRNKVKYSDDWSGYDFLNENFKKASLGKTVVNLEDLEFWGVYYDAKFTRQVYDDMLTTAGTCYIAVSLTPEKQKQYHNYQVVALRISVSGGTGLKKGNVTLKESVYTLRLDTMTLLNPKTLQTDYVTLNFNDSLKMDDFTRLTLTCSTRQGGAVVKTITRADIKDKKLMLNDIDNHAPGTYTIQIKSVGKNTGSLKLTYKVRR